MTTQQALIALAHNPDKRVPYWRVVNQNGNLISRFPGGVQQHAKLLQGEGFTIDTKGKALKVVNFKEYLMQGS